MSDKKTSKTEEADKKLWSAPKVRSFGDAVDIIKAANVVSSGDADYAVLAS